MLNFRAVKLLTFLVAVITRLIF